MKVAGGMLTVIGVFLVLINILFQNSTGNKMDASAVIIGVFLAIVGIFLYNKKQKDKDKRSASSNQEEK